MRSRLLFALVPLAATAACTSILGDFKVGTASPASDGGGTDGAPSDVGAGDVRSDAPLADAPNDALGAPWTVRPLRVAAGKTHSCAVVLYDRPPEPSRSIVYCWGSNALMQLGVSGAPPLGPVVPAFPVNNGPAAFEEISSSSQSDTTCVRDQRQRVWCWGANYEGAAGQGSGGVQTGPTEPLRTSASSELATAVPVAVGGGHGCAVTNGQVACWGANGRCQGGSDDGANCPNGGHYATTYAKVLAQCPAPSHVAAGFDYSLCLAGGVAYCWGGNTQKVCGDTGAVNVVPSPLRINDPGSGQGLSLQAVAAGVGHVVALDPNGRLFAWGSNGSGAVDPAQPAAAPLFPTVPALPFSGTAFIAAGNQVSCAVARTPRELWCWGENGNAQLGQGNVNTPGLPGKVTGLSDVVSVAVGGSHACAVARGPQDPVPASQSVYCWGNNASGQVGGQAAPAITTPRQMAFPRNPPQ
jgi:alpha-tubulin suppressor-like RCC1 family protein